MTSAPYALGVFRRPAAAATGGRDGDSGEFTGLVVGDLVRDVSGFGTMNDLLDHRDCAQSRLDELAATVPSAGQASDAARSGDSGPWIPLAGLDVRCPVSPGQILQCGANYRSHVVDLVMAERRADESVTGRGSQLPEAEVRAWAEAMMDEHARQAMSARPAHHAQPAPQAHPVRPALPSTPAPQVPARQGRAATTTGSPASPR